MRKELILFIVIGIIFIAGCSSPRLDKISSGPVVDKGNEEVIGDETLPGISQEDMDEEPIIDTSEEDMEEEILSGIEYIRDDEEEAERIDGIISTSSQEITDEIAETETVPTEEEIPQDDEEAFDTYTQPPDEEGPIILPDELVFYGEDEEVEISPDEELDGIDIIVESDE